MIFTHKIALDLNIAQETYCRRASGTARLVYNWGLAEWRRQYAAGEHPTAQKLKSEWNRLKYERYPWLTDIHRDAHAQPFANLATAFAKFFRHEAKYPQFKKKGVRDSFYVANDKCRLQGKRIRLPKVGWLRMREALRFTGKLMSAVVSCAAGRWFVSLAVQLDTPFAPCETQAGCVGVDLGITTLATFSTGEKIAGPKPLKAALRKLRRLNRELARRVKGSENWRKTRQKVAKLHARITALRTDTLHKVTTTLAQSFRCIVIEDLHVKGMVRNHKLSRAISDMGWGRFRQLLTYKTQAYGSTLFVANRWFPSSKLCMVCGVLCETLTLKDRIFHCAACGHSEDRDAHAARNLQNYPRLEGK